LYSLITEHCSTIQIAGSDGTEYFVRDYREVPLPDMEEAYEEAFREKVVKPQTKILVSK
jgi:hypothetical protein